MSWYGRRKGTLYTPVKKYKDASLGKRINDLMKDSDFIHNANDWQKQFIQSLDTQFTAGRGLSQKQIDHLEKIETDFSEDAKMVRKEWENLYRGTKLEHDTKLVARYYRREGSYYKSLVCDILDHDIIPSRKRYEQFIVKNNYAKNVIENHYSEPLFEIGKLAQGRKKTFSRSASSIAGKMVLILDINHAPPNSCKGGKKYLVMDCETAHQCEVEERDLKNIPKNIKE